MKNNFTFFRALVCYIVVTLSLGFNTLHAQCVNADFSDGNFTGWTGTYSAHQCSGQFLAGLCAGCSNTNPLDTVGFNQGPLNDPPADATNEWSHIITSTAGGNDPNLTSLGFTLPMVWPGGASTYSARQGNMWQDVGSDETGDGETTTYTFVVTPQTASFTYHYAVIVNDGGHPIGQQPYFSIVMKSDGVDSIPCGDYYVDGTTAQRIGGFIDYPSSTSGPVLVKPWSSVLVPLNNYIGHTVSITFTTRGCLPSGCAGSHYCYAYFSAECGPLALKVTAASSCSAQNATITAPANCATYAWTGPGITTDTTHQTITISQAGHYSCTMTTFGAEDPCTFTLDTTVSSTISSIVPNFSAGNACAGSPTNFTDLSTPSDSITSWAWQFLNNGVTNSTLKNPSYTFRSAGTYPVKLTVGTASCTAEVTINVVVSNPPTSTFSVSSPVCLLDSAVVLYTGTALNTAIYAWNFDGGTAAFPTSQNPRGVIWATSGTKTISLTVNVNGCISSPTTEQVVVSPAPSVFITGNTTICPGSSTTLTASGATTYQWAANPTLNATNLATVVATPTATSTIYTVTGTSAGCTVTASTTVLWGGSGIALTLTHDTAICTGNSVTLNANGATNYQWSPGTGLNTTTGSTVIATPAGTTTYTVTASNGNCSATGSVVVAVSAAPTSTFTTLTPVCTNGASNIVYTGNAPSQANYNWNFNGGVATPAGGQGPLHVTWSTPGTKTVTLTVSAGSCTSVQTSLQVVVNASPVLAISNDTTLCPGSTAPLSVSGATSYLWLNSTTLSSNSQPNVIASPTATTTYKVTGTTGSCSVTDSVTVAVLTASSSTFTATSPVCVGTNSTLTYTGSASGNATYTWNFGGGTATPGTGQGPQQVSWTGAGVHKMILDVTLNGCAAAPDTVLVVTTAPPTSTFNATGPVCVGQPSTITYTGNAGNNASYNWNFGSGTVQSGSGQGPYQVNWPAADTLNVTLVVEQNGCSSVTTTNRVVINNGPSASFRATSPVCAGQGSVINYTGSAGNNATYTWNFSGGTSLSGSGSGPYVVSWPAASTQYITLVVSANGCTSAPDTVPVVINAVPVSNAGNDAAYCSGSTVNIGGASTAGYTYSWSPANGLNFTTISNPAVSLTNTTDSVITQTYTVFTNNAGCLSNASVTVTVNPNPTAAFATGLPVCEGEPDSVTFTGTAASAAVFTWNFGGGNIVSGTGSGPYRVNWSTVGKAGVSLTVSQYGCVNTATDSVNVQICTGIAVPGANNINIYPNPAKNDFTIQVTGSIGNGQLEMYDVLGQRIYSDEINNASTGFTKHIRLNLSAGVYLLVLRDGEKVYSKKVVIER